MYKENHISIPGISGIIDINRCIKVLTKCIDIIDLKEQVIESIKIESPPPVIDTEGLNIGDEGMWHGGERRILDFDELGNVEIIEIGTENHTKVSLNQFKKEFRKFPEENVKHGLVVGETYNRIDGKGTITNIREENGEIYIDYDFENGLIKKSETQKIDGFKNSLKKEAEDKNEWSEAISTLDMLLQDEPGNSEWLEAKETLEMLGGSELSEKPKVLLQPKIEAEEMWNNLTTKERKNFLTNHKLSDFKGAHLAKYKFLDDRIKQKIQERVKRLNPDINPKVYAALLEEAKADKKWAIEKEKEVGREWEGASEVSRKMLAEKLDKSVEELAKEHHNWLSVRAHAVSETTGYPIDKAAKKKWEELSGEEIKSTSK